MTKYKYYRLAKHFTSKETCATELAQLHLYLDKLKDACRKEVTLARALAMQRSLRNFGFIVDDTFDLGRDEWARITEEPHNLNPTQALIHLTRYLYFQTGCCSFEDFLDFRKSAAKSMPIEESCKYLYTKYLANLETPWRADLPKTPYSTSACHSPSVLSTAQLVDEILAVHHCITSRTRNELTRSSKNTVDIIMPVYGKIDFTLRCIHSVVMEIADSTRGGRQDAVPSIIIVDDASPDKVGIKELSTLDASGVCRLLQNKANIGYLKSCNAGAYNSQAEYLVFLNNDTNVCQGWLLSLLRTFNHFPSAGLVGSKLLYPDGLLQEAGGIVWRDGSAWNYGRGQSPLNPEFSYLRSVDYISGASFAIRRSLFNELGGFDVRYAPAYYEDTDLCLKVREAGYDVLFQPCSRVVHHEGISCGKETSGGIKRYQIINRRKFFVRWQQRLLDSHEKNGNCTPSIMNRGIIGRCLVIETSTLSPDQDAGSRFVLDHCMILRSLGYEVTYVPAGNFRYWEDKTPLLQGYGIRALYSPFVKSIDEAFEWNHVKYDFCIVCRPEQASILERVRINMGKKPIFYFTHDIHHRRMIMENSINPGSHSEEAIRAIKEDELRSISLSTCTIHISEEERDYMDSVIKHESIVISPTIEADRTDEYNGTSNTILFIGSARHSPNPDAILWFANEVLPIIRAHIDCSFLIVGSGYSETFRRLLSNSYVKFMGFVSDISEIFGCAAISVAPLRFGAGVKGKVIESFAHGVPCIMSEIAAEGLKVDTSSILDRCISKGELVASEFADICIQALSNPELGKRLSTECRDHYNKHFSKTACTQNWIDLLDRHRLPHHAPSIDTKKGYNSRHRVHPVSQSMAISAWDMYQYATVHQLTQAEK